MARSIFAGVVAIGLCFLIGIAAADAQGRGGGHGFGVGAGGPGGGAFASVRTAPFTPPGFSRGQKRGWVNGRPPGWSRSKGRKTGWGVGTVPPGLR